MLKTGTGRAAAAAIAGLALAAGTAGAQDTTRTDGTGSGGRRAVQAMVAGSAAFRDSVQRALADGPGGGFAYETPLSKRWADRLFAGFTLAVSQPTGDFNKAAVALAVRKFAPHVAPSDTEDVRALARPVLRHRVLINFQAQSERVTTDQLVAKLLDAVPLPRSAL